MAWPSLADIRTRLRVKLNETTASFWANAQLDRWINDGERDIAIKTGCIRNIDSTTSTASSRLVSFSGLRVNDVEYVPATGTRVMLKKILPHMMGHVISKGNTPQYWFPWDRYVVLEPLPTLSTYNLNLYISDYPFAELSADADTPTIAAEFQELILEYAFAKAVMKDKKFLLGVIKYMSYLSNLHIAKTRFEGNRKSSSNELKTPDAVLAQSQVK